MAKWHMEFMVKLAAESETNLASSIVGLANRQLLIHRGRRLNAFENLLIRKLLLDTRD